jgi:hypothetical protein
MSTTPTSSVSGYDFSADDADYEHPWWSPSTELERTVTHVFDPFTPEAQRHEYSHPINDFSLIHSVSAVTRAHGEIIDDTLKPQWRGITNLLDILEASVLSGRLDTEGHVIPRLCEMQTGGMLLISLQTLC